MVVVSGRPRQPSIAVIGRVTWPVPGDPDHILSSWPGTRIGVRFWGTGLFARMASGPADVLCAPVGDRGSLVNAFDITVDGRVRPVTITLSREAADLQVTGELPLGEHEVWMERQTEAVRAGRVEVFSVGAVGGNLLPPPAARLRRIEVVGTSIETGVHVGLSAGDESERHVDGCACPFRSQNQNRAWPKLAGDLLRAEVINVSMEGAGLLVGYQAFAGVNAQLPDIYARADLFAPAPQWDAKTYPVDVVLAAVGWSDATLLDLRVRAHAARLRSAYDAFLRQVRAAQPRARIYAVVRSGASRGWRRRAMAAVIEAAVGARRASGDDNVAVMSLPSWSSAASHCYDHPSWAQQEALGRAAAAMIRLDMRW